MLVIFQISLGSAVLLVCALVHILLIARMSQALSERDHFGADTSRRHQLLTVCLMFLGTILSHTIQIYICAFTLWMLGALPGYEEPIYFSLVTYTSLGYGDVVLDKEFRIFGAMISVTGLVMFGMTTAFLVGVFRRLLGPGRG